MNSSLISNSLKLLIGAAALSSTAVDVWSATDLAPPFRVEANGKPIETAGGNAAPCVMDFDGNGVWDLLVGQFKDGKLLIFTNAGTAAAVEFGAGAWFKAGGADARVPAG